MPEVTVRPLREEDLPTIERISEEGFAELDARTLPRDRPVRPRRTPEQNEPWALRARHLLATDPHGCWVAELDPGPAGDGPEVVGYALSSTRELMWILASYVVRPGLQGHGVGTQLLTAAAHHGRGCLRAMLSASADPRATRRYRLAGFDLHPQMVLTGCVDRSRLPVVVHVREGTPGDRDLLDSLDRRARGAAHGADHEVLGRLFRLVVADRPSGQGYAYIDDTGAPRLLAATDRRTARDLTWEALASSRPEVPVEVAHVTGANQWALDVGLEARLAIGQSGYLAVRGMKPPTCYLHHGSFL